MELNWSIRAFGALGRIGRASIRAPTSGAGLPAQGIVLCRPHASPRAEGCAQGGRESGRISSKQIREQESLRGPGLLLPDAQRYASRFGILRNYLPGDHGEQGQWPCIWSGGTRVCRGARRGRTKTGDPSAGASPTPCAVACIQYQQRARWRSLRGICRRCGIFVDVPLADYKSTDFAVLPGTVHCCVPLDRETRADFPRGSGLATAERTVPSAPSRNCSSSGSGECITISHSHSVGSHPTLDKRTATCVIVCLMSACANGSIHAAGKDPSTPNEAYWWSIVGADDVRTIQTDCGPIGV